VYSEPVDVLVRPVFAPCELAWLNLQGNCERLEVTGEFNHARSTLRRLLRAIFRKRDFREGQAEAIYRTLSGKDSIVLLPTGGGKSIIYQLSGLL
jgi:superfamily II DNA helicase RecQ